MNKLYENGPAIKKEMAREKRKKKKSTGLIKVAAHAGMKGLCLRDLGDDIICMEPRVSQACVAVNCDDRDAWGFITPCSECAAEIMKLELPPLERQAWLRENYPLIVADAIAENNKRIFGADNARTRTDRKTASA